MVVNLEDAKADLSSLIERAASGEDVLIAAADRPLVRLVPVEQAQHSKAPPRKPGMMKGQIWMADDFDDPLPPDILKAFYGETCADAKPPASGHTCFSLVAR